jgi:hypothetical protein
VLRIGVILPRAFLRVSHRTELEFLYGRQLLFADPIEGLSGGAFRDVLRVEAVPLLEPVLSVLYLIWR